MENISKILSMSGWTCSLCSMKLSILLKLKMTAWKKKLKKNKVKPDLLPETIQI